MKNTQGLKTLRDYRRVAKDLLFEVTGPPPIKSKSNCPYDAIKTALAHSIHLTNVSRSRDSVMCAWNAVHLFETKYAMNNIELFYCIKLMEFATTYGEVESMYQLLPNWPKRPDANAMAFTFAGLSYLEAVFNCVLNLGSQIIGGLQSAYNKDRKEGRIMGGDPFEFLSKTPTVDDLEINPVPDIIIRTWFDDIVKRMQRGFPESEFAGLKMVRECELINTQLEYEWNLWKKTASQQEPKSAAAGGGNEAEDNMQATSKTTKRKVEAIRDQVFICYSHKDKRWLEDLQIHLKPYVRNGSVTAWSDKQIAPGSKWFPEIEAALAHTKVAALLVTPHFLASDFIHENELTPLLKEAEKGDVRIIWVPVRACAYKETPLKDYQAAINTDKPLANMKAERDKAWVKICEEIKKAVSR